jgi:DUF4097 and DUF4098 domain-containing protein YvlB
MIDVLLVAATLVSAAGPVTPPIDTLVALQRGDRVVLQNLEGEITVRAWDREELEIRGEEDEMPLLVRRTGSTVRITRDDRKGRRRSVEASIRVPAWVDLEVGGPSLDVWIDGVDGRLEVNGVSGDVWVENAGGPVQVRTIEGEIDVSLARGGVDASSQSDEVRLRDVSGPVNVHSGSGDLTLRDISSAVVRAETQDGDITFSGTIEDGGDYRFFVHDGDASIEIPSTTNARVAVSTFDGDFESDFPVRIERFTGGREFDFTIGNGAAHIEIQVFDGEIRLLERR